MQVSPRTPYMIGNCERCDVLFERVSKKWGTVRRFCSRKCAGVRVSIIVSDSTKRKLSEKLKAWFKIHPRKKKKISLASKKCPQCKIKFQIMSSYRYIKKFCSKICAIRYHKGSGLKRWREQNPGLIKEIAKNRRHAKKKSKACCVCQSPHFKYAMTCSNKCFRVRMSFVARESRLGGHNSSTTIRFKCKDGSVVVLQSSYEVSVANDLDKNNIGWIRPKPLRWIDDSGVAHRYFPDFYIPSLDIYLDPKNDYLISMDNKKIETVSRQNRVKIFILNKTQLNWSSIVNLLASRLTVGHPAVNRTWRNPS